MIAITAGCGPVTGQGATASGCANSAVIAVRRHLTVTAFPASCRGLGPSGLNQAIRIAVSQLSLPGDKSVQRHRAGLARVRLRYLIGAADRAAAAARRTASRRGSTGHPSAAASAPGGMRIPAGAAALAAWLLAAMTGAVLASGVLRRRPLVAAGRSGQPAVPPGSRQRADTAGPATWIVLAHAGLAIGGLIVWAGYLASRWTPLAWASVAILLPVAGLGISTLMLTIPDAPGPRRARAPVLVIAAHGALATMTILLALLGAVTALTTR
jgi:hypothetical protein